MTTDIQSSRDQPSDMGGVEGMGVEGMGVKGMGWWDEGGKISQNSF